MIRRYAPSLLFILGSGLLAVAAVMHFATDDAPGFVVDNPAREDLTLTAGTTTTVEFSVHNPTRHTVRVIGLAIC